MRSPAKFKLRRVILKSLVLLIGLLVMYFSLRWVGTAQQGNLLAFFGSVVMIIPPVRVMLDNWVFHQAAIQKTEDPLLKSIQVKIGKAQVVTYVRFSWVDAISYLVGMLLIAIGFLLQVLGLTLPV